MNTKEVQVLERYFKTKNERWNVYAFGMLCEVLQRGNFENIETPLKLLSNAVDIFTKHFETPLKAVQLFEDETNIQKLDANQKMFVFESVLKYFKHGLLEKENTDEALELLSRKTENLRVEINKLSEQNRPLTGNIRDTLKDLMQNELKQLPETLKKLDPVQRLNILCKLMPYVLPKTESVKYTLGEPETPENNCSDKTRFMLLP